MSKKTSIIICTLNEAKFVENCINEILNKIPNVELIIVDDNSSDGTTEIIKNHKQANKFKFIQRSKGVGLASAFSRGVMEVTGDYIGWIDTNMAYLVPKFSEMQGDLSSSSDIVVLSRYIKGGSDERSYLRSTSSKLINLFCKFIFSSKINDFTSGLFLMKKEIINEIPIIAYGHGEFFIEFLYNIEKKNYKVLEIPYVQRIDIDPINSKSAPNNFKFFILGIQYMVRILVSRLRKI